MKRTFQKLLALTLALVMSIGMSTTVFANEANTADGNGDSKFFGTQSGASLYSGSIYYEDLSTNGKLLYNGLKEELASPVDSWLSFKLSGVNANNFSVTDLFQAYGAIRNEWPELIYWADTGVSVYTSFAPNTSTSTVNYFVLPQLDYVTNTTPKEHKVQFPSGLETFKYWTLKTADPDNEQKKAEAAAQEVLADAPDGSDFDKVEYFNDWIIDNAEYDWPGIAPNAPYDNTFHMAGIFNDGLAVCEGYAKAFKYLCDKSGIDCLYVTGNLEVPGDAPGPHAWNYVKLDGAWYIVDSTNNDPSDDGKGPRNIALCIGSESTFGTWLVPDKVLTDGVWVLAPDSVTLSKTPYRGNIKSIIDIEPPVKTEYFAGEELDLTDAFVYVERLNGEKWVLPMNAAEMLSGFDMNKVGTYSVTVTVGTSVMEDSFEITVKNAPVTLTVSNAVTSYAPGVTSLDLSTGSVLVTYADPAATPNVTYALNDEEHIEVVLAPGLSTVTGFPVGKFDITVNLIGDVKPLSTTYEITVGNPNPNPNPGGGSSSGGRPSHADPSYPSADSGIKSLTDIKKVDLNNLPSGITLTKTAANTPIGVITISLADNGGLSTSTISALSKLPSNVGLMIKQGKGAVEMILPGGFTMVPEAGRFSYPLAYNPVAENKAEMLAAIKTKDARSETLTIGGNVVLPLKASISVKTSIADGTTLNIYRFDPATKKNVLVGSGKVVGGRIAFSTNTLGQFIITTGSI